MGLTINRPGVDPYSNNLLKKMDESGQSVQGHHRGEARPEEGGRSEGAVRLSISNEALFMLKGEKAPAQKFENLSAEDRERMHELAAELDEIVGGAGGFRKLTDTQWERVEDIFGEIAEINGIEDGDKPRIAELRRVHELENELDGIYGDDPDKVLSSEEKDRVEEIMLELEELWGEEGEEIVLTEDEERKLAAIEEQLEAMAEKLDKWTLTPEDEEEVDKLFSAMDRIFDRAEQRMMREQETEERTVEGV